MKLLQKLLIGLLTLTIVGGCQARENPEPAQEEGLKIAVTIAPLYSFALSLTDGTNAKVIYLVPPNANEHDFQMTPQSAKDLEMADIIVMNGVGLETFLLDAISQSKAKVVDSSAGVDLLKAQEIIAEDEEEHDDFDPHIWLNPNNAVKQVDNILAALIEKDPANERNYVRNATVLKARLVALDNEIKTEIAKLNQKPFIVFHDAYQYFEQAYGLNSEAAFEPAPGKEPSPQYLQQIVEMIRAKNIKVIFTEPQFSPKLVQTLAQDYNLQIGELDPIGQELDRDGYFKMMRKNLSELQKAFAGQ